jgi:hypothetical protein
MFALIVDNLAIQYIGNAYLDHLCQALKKHYEVSEEIDGTRFAGMPLKWNYSPIHAKPSCCLSIPGNIFNVGNHIEYDNDGDDVVGIGKLSSYSTLSIQFLNHVSYVTDLVRD